MAFLPHLHLPTTVHKDVTDRLKSINPSLYREVGLVLEQNKQERHMRGGEATKQKYLQLKQTASLPKDTAIDEIELLDLK